MKRLFMVAMAAVGLLASCSKGESEIIKSTAGAVVNVSFAEDTTTRTFFSSTASAESWEKELHRMTMFIFNPTGELLVQREFGQAELASRKATFALPNVTPGTECRFYAVANYDVGSVTCLDDLEAVLEDAPEKYNGTFADVTTKALRSGGFVMSGHTSQVVAAAGSATNVSINLKRTVAKVAVQVTPSVAFGTLYQGAIRVNNISISRSASESYVVASQAVRAPIAMEYESVQASNKASGAYQNLFYIFENDGQNTGSCVLMTIDATYDMDGDFSSPAGQSSMTYEVEVSGSAAGEILRNGYYRIDITVNGLSGSDATMSITPAEWESPVTQSVEIGA